MRQQREAEARAAKASFSLLKSLDINLLEEDTLKSLKSSCGVIKFVLCRVALRGG